MDFHRLYPRHHLELQNLPDRDRDVDSYLLVLLGILYSILSSSVLGCQVTSLHAVSSVDLIECPPLLCNQMEIGAWGLTVKINTRIVKIIYMYF